MRSTIIAVSLALASVGIASAQTKDEDHAAHHPDAQASQPGQPKEAPAATPAAESRFKSIEDLMSRIQQAGDAPQRASLLRQHALALREQVKAMRASSAKRMAMMGGDGKQAAGGDDPHAAHKAAPAGDDPHAAHRVQKPDEDEHGAQKADDDPHAAHAGAGSEAAAAGKSTKKGMMGGSMMKMHESVERRLDAIERLLEQLIEREVVESDVR